LCVCDIAGGEQADNGRETPRSPTVTASGSAVTAGSSHAERSSSCSDSTAVSSGTSTDHAVYDRHSADELTSKVSLSISLVYCAYVYFSQTETRTTRRALVKAHNCGKV